MESCAFFIRYQELSARTGHIEEPPADKSKASIASWIYWLFAPEPSELQPHCVRRAAQGWKGTLKAIFWIGMSIGTSLLLATLCS